MSIETPDQVEQFIKLQAKELPELQAICEGLKLETQGNKADLIDRLVALTDIQPQSNLTLPQALPLCTKDHLGREIPNTIETYKTWRKLIFETKDNLKEFSLINSRGKRYQAKLRYVLCSQSTLKVILQNRWYLPHNNQRDLVNLLKTHSENFRLCIVQKPDSQGGSWLMLHCEPKTA